MFWNWKTAKLSVNPSLWPILWAGLKFWKIDKKYVEGLSEKKNFQLFSIYFRLFDNGTKTNRSKLGACTSSPNRKNHFTQKKSVYLQLIKTSIYNYSVLRWTWPIEVCRGWRGEGERGNFIHVINLHSNLIVDGNVGNAFGFSSFRITGSRR